MSDPPFHLRRLAILWLPLFAVGAIFFAQAAHHFGMAVWGACALSIAVTAFIFDRPPKAT